jgi:hypothetical protein
VSKPSDNEKNNPFRVNGTLVEEQNFGQISVSGGKNNRVLKVDFINTKGSVVGSWSVGGDELMVK